MSKEADILVRAMKELFKAPLTVQIATVTAVDETALTCDVQLLENDTIEISDVRLKAAIDNGTDGLVQIPTVGSTVLVGMIGNDDNTQFVIAFSAVTKVVMFGGTNGGLINIQTLITELNKTNALVNAIKNSLANWTPVGGDGGAALKTYAGIQMAGKATGDFSSMEDVKVKH